MANASVFLGNPEVQTDGLGVPDVQKPVGLWRKPCHNPLIELARFVVGLDLLTNEIHRTAFALVVGRVPNLVIHCPAPWSSSGVPHNSSARSILRSTRSRPSNSRPSNIPIPADFPVTATRTG